jgi:hypothetical protein
VNGGRAPLTVIQQTRQRLPWCAVSPHLEQYGGEKNVIGDQQRPQSESGSPTILPHAKQRGGSTISTIARPISRSRTGSIAARFVGCIIRRALPPSTGNHPPVYG